MRSLALLVLAGCAPHVYANKDAPEPPADTRPIDSMVMCGGIECMLTHATAACVNDTCVVQQCDVGYADCDHQDSDGCEIAIASDPMNCGACGNTCASGACGTSIAASMATLPTGWSFNGSATYSASTMTGLLTDTTTATAGTIIYEHALPTDSFDASFDFSITAGTQGNADGLAFMLETDGPTAVGNAYAGLGITTLHGYGFELDTFDNMMCGDSDANHVGIDQLQACGTGGEPTGLTAMPAPFGLRDGNVHTCTVSIANGVATVLLDGTPVIKAFSLPGFTSGTAYYYGFGGANGGGADTHAIKNVTITFPSPRCL